VADLNSVHWRADGILTAQSPEFAFYHYSPEPQAWWQGTITWGHAEVRVADRDYAGPDGSSVALGQARERRETWGPGRIDGIVMGAENLLNFVIVGDSYVRSLAQDAQLSAPATRGNVSWGNPIEDTWYNHEGPSSLDAAGTGWLNMSGVVVTGEHDNQTFRIDGRDRPSDSPIPAQTETTLQFFFQDVRFKADDFAIAIATRGGSHTLEGTLTAAAATGRVDFADLRHTLPDAATVAIDGSFDLDGNPAGELGLDGEADSVVIAGQLFAVPAPNPPRRAATLTIGLATVAAALLGWAAYVRLKPAQVLANDSRAALFAVLKASVGGARLGDLARATGTPRPTARYHLDILVRAGFVVRNGDGAIYRVAGEAAASALAQPARRALVDALLEGPGGSTQAELAAHLGTGRRTAAHHLAILTADELVTTDGGRPARYNVTPRARALVADS